jgi:hypothetical protein
MMNVSMRVIEKLHEYRAILDSGKTFGQRCKSLMENGIFDIERPYAGPISSAR